MTKELVLNLAAPAEAAEWLQPPLPRLVQHGHLCVAYLSIGGIYIEDLNDDPERASTYDAGLAVWPTAVRNVLSALCQLSHTALIELTPVKPTIGTRLHRLVFERQSSGEQWISERILAVSPQAIQSMSSYAWPPILWTTTTERMNEYQTDQGLSTADLEALIQARKIPWWGTHGYKEPYLILSTYGITREELGKLLDAHTTVAIQNNEQSHFVPHRMRMHRSQRRNETA